jgi:hypothetical protein
MRGAGSGETPNSPLAREKIQFSHWDDVEVNRIPGKSLVDTAKASVIRTTPNELSVRIIEPAKNDNPEVLEERSGRRSGYNNRRRGAVHCLAWRHAVTTSDVQRFNWVFRL